MKKNLDKILVFSNDPSFKRKINRFYSRQKAATKFAIDSEEMEQVLNIVRDVSNRGDKAVAEYTSKYDNVNLSPSQFRVKKEALKQAHQQLDATLLKSIRKAIRNVKQYQKKIYLNFRSKPGIKYITLDSVGICVPGAAAPLFSTVIMCAVPAQVAGVERIVIVSPPRYNGSIHPVTLAVCFELGITDVYRVGGAQAVAALASEKGTIPQVSKIVGPGNKWVQTAKKMVGMDYAAIESIAGPSEVLILANESANPEYVAADMLSQAEHGIDSTAITITSSGKLGRKVLNEIKKQLAGQARSAKIEKSLSQSGLIIVTHNLDEAIERSNYFAPEHLQIQCGDKSRQIAEKIKNAGAIFIGDYTPVAVGDYWAGPSHSLPTGRTAKFSSALTSNDFVKSISIIEYDKKMLAESSKDIIRLAETEGLDAHAKSIKIRQ